jgi:uncharacterized protein YpiB (UPF0302 family)
MLGDESPPSRDRSLEAEKEPLDGRPDSEFGLAIRLKWWRNKAEDDGASKEIRAQTRQDQRKQLLERIIQALDANDTAFLHRLWKASQLLALRLSSS